MASTHVVEYFTRVAPHLVPRIHVFTDSSATVALAAQCLGCRPEHIAKSLTFGVKASKDNAKAASGEGDTTASDKPQPIVIVAAGDAMVSAKKFKAKFGCKNKMLDRDKVEEAVGHPAGGVCPFALKDDVRVYLDVSLKRFTTVYPACGTGNTGVPVTPEELEKVADHFVEWIDVCDKWQDTPLEADDNRVNEEAKAKEAIEES